MCSSNTFHFFTIFKLAGDCLWNFDGFYITHLSKNGNIQKQEFLWLTFSLYRGLYKVSYSAWGVYIIQRIWPVHTNKKPWREPSIPFLQIHLCTSARQSRQYLTNVQWCYRQFGRETIHPTQKFTSMNLLPMPWVIT